MITKDQVSKALHELLEERARYAAALGLPDPADPSRRMSFPPLPEPASADAIRDLEMFAGSLPPSYRHFLEMYDGLQKFDVGADLLPAANVVRVSTSLVGRRSSKMLAILERADLVGLLVIGATERGTIRFLFDTNTSDAEGEWKVLEYGEEDEFYVEHDNFLEMLVSVTEVMREAGGEVGDPS